jgi:Putative Zn-dependent protease, contains TPR repeats
MTFVKFFLFSSAIAISATAAASTLSVGSGPARICFLATESENRPSADQIQQCDIALNEAGLGSYETVATYVNRGVLQVRRGQVELGLADFDRAIALDANEPEAYLNKGSAMVRLGQPQEALPLFSMALDKKTRKPAVAYYGRAVAHEETGNARMAYLDYRRAMQADPKWAQPRQEMSRFRVSPR